LNIIYYFVWTWFLYFVFTSLFLFFFLSCNTAWHEYTTTLVCLHCKWIIIDKRIYKITSITCFLKSKPKEIFIVLFFAVVLQLKTLWLCSFLLREEQIVFFSVSLFRSCWKIVIIFVLRKYLLLLNPTETK